MDGHIILALMGFGLVVWDVVSFPKLLRDRRGSLLAVTASETHRR